VRLAVVDGRQKRRRDIASCAAPQAEAYQWRGVGMGRGSTLFAVPMEWRKKRLDACAMHHVIARYKKLAKLHACMRVRLQVDPRAAAICNTTGKLRPRELRIPAPTLPPPVTLFRRPPPRHTIDTPTARIPRRHPLVPVGGIGCRTPPTWPTRESP
jgi:hypothetical protein